MSDRAVQLLKRLAAGALSLYTWPLRINERVSYYAKGTCFPAGSEHLYRAVRFIQCISRVDLQSVIVDAGAAGGGTAEYLRRAFPANRILAFEPNPRMAKELSARTRRIPNIDVRNIALGSARRTQLLHVTANDLSSSLQMIDQEELCRLPADMQSQFSSELSVNVSVSTLDIELQGVHHVLLLKLDTQGTELDILQGADAVLTRTDFILTEMNNHHLYNGACQYHEVDSYLRVKGFSLADIIVSYYPASGMQEYDALYHRVGR